MKSLEFTRRFLGKDITARVLRLESGLHVSLFGGTLPHIGAVSIVPPEGACSTVEFPGHRERVVSEAWAQAFAGAGYRPVVVEAGIHYDNLDSVGISQVLRLTDELLADVLRALQ